MKIKEPRGERLAIAFPDYLGVSLTTAMRLSAAFIRTSLTISRGSITAHEFPVKKMSR